MPQLRILFDLNQLGNQSPSRVAFRRLFSVLDCRQLAGCALYHDLTEPSGSYCIALYSEDGALLSRLARVAQSSAWNLPAPPAVFFQDVPLRTDRLVLAAKVDAAGQLTDVGPEWLWEVKREAEMGGPPPRPNVMPDPPPMTMPPPPPPASAPEPRAYPPPFAGPPVAGPSLAGPSLAGPAFAAPVAGRAGMGVGESPSPAGFPGPAPAPFPSPTPAPLAPQPFSTLGSFPRSVPSALASPAARSRAIAALMGVVAGLALAAAFFELSPRTTMLFAMFDLRKPSTIIPVAILVMFFWGAALCLDRWRCVRAMESISKPDLLDAAVSALDRQGVRGLVSELEGPAALASPLLKRLRAVLHQWSRRPNLQDADVVLQQLAVSDDEAVHAGYSLARTFVWALPVLGLIGTVIGIALAVGGFSTFLGGNIDDVAVIKQNLVNVTGGLSFAFLITLEGLLTSLLLMLAASGLQTRERGLYARVQQQTADVLVPALQRIAPETSGVRIQSSQPDGPAFREALADAAQSMAARFEAVSNRIVEAMDLKHAEWQGQLASTAAQIVMAIGRREEKAWELAQQKTNALTQGVTDGIGTAASALSADLSKTSTEFTRALEETRLAFATQADTFLSGQQLLASSLGAQAEAAVGRQTELLERVAEQAQASRAAASVVNGLAESTRLALQSQQSLQMVMEGFGEALRTSSAQMQSAVKAAETLGGLTQEVLVSHVSLQAATQQLADSKLAATLAEFRECLVRMTPVLAGFQRPFVLQAVPMPQNQTE